MKIERVKKNSGILLSSLSTGDVFSLKGTNRETSICTQGGTWKHNLYIV